MFPYLHCLQASTWFTNICLAFTKRWWCLLSSFLSSFMWASFASQDASDKDLRTEFVFLCNSNWSSLEYRFEQRMQVCSINKPPQCIQRWQVGKVPSSVGSLLSFFVEVKYHLLSHFLTEIPTCIFDSYIWKTFSPKRFFVWQKLAAISPHRRYWVLPQLSHPSLLQLQVDHF